MKKIIKKLRPEQQPGQAPWLTVREYADKYNLTVSEVHSRLLVGRLLYAKIGRYYFIQDQGRWVM